MPSYQRHKNIRPSRRMLGLIRASPKYKDRGDICFSLYNYLQEVLTIWSPRHRGKNDEPQARKPQVEFQLCHSSATQGDSLLLYLQSRNYTTLKTLLWKLNEISHHKIIQGITFLTQQSQKGGELRWDMGRISRKISKNSIHTKSYVIFYVWLLLFSILQALSML